MICHPRLGELCEGGGTQWDLTGEGQEKLHHCCVPAVLRDSLLQATDSGPEMGKERGARTVTQERTTRSEASDPKSLDYGARGQPERTWRRPLHEGANVGAE